MHESADASSPIPFRAAPGVVGRISRCAAGWCRFDVGGRAGLSAPTNSGASAGTKRSADAPIYRQLTAANLLVAALDLTADQRAEHAADDRAARTVAAAVDAAAEQGAGAGAEDSPVVPSERRQ